VIRKHFSSSFQS